MASQIHADMEKEMANFFPPPPDKQWMSQRRVDYPFPMASESDEGREGGEGEGEGEEGEGGREGLLQIPNKKYKARASQRKTAKRSVSECMLIIF